MDDKKISQSYSIAPIYIAVFLAMSMACSTNPIPEIVETSLPKSYMAPYTDEAPLIDGQMDPGVWELAPWTDDFIDIEGIEKPPYDTRIKMLWDDTHYYILARLYEPHIWGNLRQRDTIIFYNNDFELFIDPDGDTHQYLEVEVNALNTVWDLFLEKPYRNKTKADTRWDLSGLQTAVTVSGTLNNPTDTDAYWQLEMALPWEGMRRGMLNAQPPRNTFWRMNFSRVNWDFDLEDGQYRRKKDSLGRYLPEYNWVWSPQGVINMHQPEHWGYVYFADESTDTVALPEDAALLQWMYTHYRSELQKIKDGTPTTPRYESRFRGYTVYFQHFAEGENSYWLTESPITKTTYKIQYDGKRIIL